MAQKLYRNKTVMAKIESTYGTDPTPDGSDAILTSNLSITPYQGNTVSRNLDRINLGNEEQINTGPNVQVTFSVELAGAGAAGTVPGFGVLLRAVGFAETIDAGKDVQYAPVSKSFESATLYYLDNGDLHKITGCRGTVSLSLGRGALPTFSFTFTGLYHRPIKAGSFSINTSEFQVPLPVTNSNTPTYTLGGYSPRAESLSIDIQNNVVHRNVVGQESVIITDRSPNGQLTIEADDVTTKNWYQTVESHNGVTKQALKIVHGTTAGNIVQIDAPLVQLSSITLQDSDGIQVLNMNAQLLPSDAGDDEIKITIK